MQWEVWADTVTYVYSTLVLEIASLKLLGDIEHLGTTFVSIILMAKVVIANCEYRKCGILGVTRDLQKP